MLDELLFFRPDQRSPGNGASDLSLYGAQPEPTGIAAPTQTATNPVDPLGTTPGPVNSPSPSPISRPAHSTEPGDLDLPSLPAASLSPATSLLVSALGASDGSPLGIVPAPAREAASDGRSAQQPSFSAFSIDGSVSDGQLGQADAGEGTPGAAIPRADAPDLERADSFLGGQSTVFAGPLAQSDLLPTEALTAGLTSQLLPALAAAPVLNVAEPIVTPVAAVTGGVVTSVAPLTDAVAGTVSTLIPTLVDTVAGPVVETVAATPVVTPIVETVAAAPLVSPVVETAATALETVSAAASPIVHPVEALSVPTTADIASPAVSVTEAASTLADEGPLLGADPAGGIATLVSLVSASDAFALHEAGSGEDDGASAALVDTLAGDVAPVDSLLGITPEDTHDDGSASADHHDIGLGL